MTTATEVNVTAKDIRTGKAGDCFLCAVGLALARSTGDDHARVVSRRYELHIEAWARWLPAPYEVRHFVTEYDDLPRKKSGRPRLPSPLPDDLEPFSFTLPPLDDPEWQEECYGCEELFDQAALDDEGRCQACR